MTDDERRARKLLSHKRCRQRNAGKYAAYAKAYRDARKKPVQPMATSKTCAHCRVDKDRSAFSAISRFKGVRSNRGGLGVEAVCKTCKSAIRKPTLEQERRRLTELRTSGLKTCNVCRSDLPFESFAVRRASPDGLGHTCRECNKDRGTQWRKAHPSAHGDWYRQNREHKKTYFSQWREQNAEHCRDVYRRWARMNPGAVNANNRARELAKRKATPQWLDRKLVKPFYREAARLTMETGIEHEVDHIVPIRSSLICGLHVPANLRVITSTENKAKSNHYDCTIQPSANDLRLSDLDSL